MNQLQIYMIGLTVFTVCILGYLLMNKTDEISNIKKLNVKDMNGQMDRKIKITWFKRPHWYPKYFDFANCPYKNCVYSTDKSEIDKSHALLFYFKNLATTVPLKPKNQIWIIANFESLANSGLLKSKWNTQFDLFLTYANGSDIVRRRSPQVRQQLLQKNYSDIFQRKSRMVAWVVSNCNTKSKRFAFYKELAKYIEIDVFGKCGNNGTMKTFCRYVNNTQCHILISKKYKFYLGFENSLCEDYVTEKLTNSYHEDHDAVVVYRGAPNIDNIFPRDTYISVDHFDSAKSLAAYLLNVGSNETAYTELLKAKQKYYIDQPDPLCLVCETMNKLSERNSSLHGRDFNAWFRTKKCKSK